MLKLWPQQIRDEAIKDADFVICAIEKDRNVYWSQDFHIPRKYGFDQVLWRKWGSWLSLSRLKKHQSNYGFSQKNGRAMSKCHFT